jgi:hypothetical protein
VDALFLMEDHFTLQECLVLVYNIIRTVSANAIEDELAEAPSSKISSSRIKGEKFHPWLESVNQFSATFASQ